MSRDKSHEDVEEKHRMWSSMAFVGVLIVVGLPLWWKTTEVYRVALPYDKISQLKDLPFSVLTRITVLANDEPTAEEVGGLLQEYFKNSEVIRIKVDIRVLDEELRKTLTAAAEDTEAVEQITERFDTSQRNHLYVVQRTRLYSNVWLSGERVALFKDASCRTLVEVLQQWVYQVGSLTGAMAARGGDAGRRVRLPPDSKYDVTLSVVHPRPEEMMVEFDAREALEDYIGTFLDELSELHNFSLHSQWLHLLELDFQAKQIADDAPWRRHYALSEDRLPHVLTPIEKRSSSHMTRHRSVNLVLYCTPCSSAPLHVYTSDKKRAGGSVEAFMSPKWGGVVIGNPDYEECRQELEGNAKVSTYTPRVRLVMGTFLAQLRELLGFNKLNNIDDATLDPLRSVYPRKWEPDAVMTIRTLEQVTQARLTLESLSQLLGEISNIVINDYVGASIKESVSSIEEASRLLGAGEISAAHASAQRAFLAAEEAFTEPSLLALLYFPDDQKYAVYIPLFLPIMIPVIFSLNNILKWLSGKNKKTKTD